MRRLECLRRILLKNFALTSTIATGQGGGHEGSEECFFRFTVHREGQATTGVIKLLPGRFTSPTKASSTTCPWAEKYLLIRPLGAVVEQEEPRHANYYLTRDRLLLLCPSDEGRV